MNRRRTLAGTGIVLILAGAAFAVVPTQSRGDLASRLSAFGVPEGAEVVAAQADANGNFITVVYRDAQGERHTIGGVERRETPAPD